MTNNNQPQRYRVNRKDVCLGTLLVCDGTQFGIAKGTIVQVRIDQHGEFFIRHENKDVVAVVSLISTEIDGVHYYEGFKLADLLIYDKL